MKLKSTTAFFCLLALSATAFGESYHVELTLDEAVPANQPVAAKVDFTKLLGGDASKIVRRSIRLLADGDELPCSISADMESTGTATIAWRSVDAKRTRYLLSFGDGEGDASERRLGPIGIGDTFHYNSGETGPANVYPLHSQYLHVDMDGDGLRDLVGWAFRFWEYEVELEKRLGNAVYYLKNVGTKGSPKFAPRRRLKDSEGNFFRSDLLPQNWFADDMDGDGDVDFYGFGPSFWLTMWENTGERDAAGVAIIKPGKPIVQLRAESEFRAASPGILRKTNAWFPRGVRRVDWEGDGEIDLIVGYRKVSRLRVVDTSKGVAPYGTAVMVYDLLENTGKTTEDGSPEYAAPVTLKDQTGIVIHGRGHANGAVEYADWDRDGDFDLLFHSETDRPLEGGRLMFAENRGTRAEPMFEAPVQIGVPLVDSPFLVDWNDDGLLDIISCGELFENVNPDSKISLSLPGSEKVEAIPGQTGPGTRIPKIRYYPKFVSRGLVQQVEPEIITYFTLSIDWENDGDLDLVGGYQTGLRLFINRGTTLEPVFEKPVMLSADGKEIYMPNFLDPQADEPSTYGPQGPTEPTYGWLLPTMGDWDGDGDLDLFATGQRWETRYFENTGTREAPVFAKGKTVTVNGATDELAWRSKISIGDIDADGTMDLIIHSDRDNAFHVCVRKAAQPDPTRMDFASGPALKLESGEPVTGWFGGQNNNSDNHTLLVDWDSDGDLDLINGSVWAVYYYENTGTPEVAKFKAHGKFKQGDNELHVYDHACSFDAADWTGDGRLDLIHGTEAPSDSPHGGVLHLFERNFLEGNLPEVTLGALKKLPKK